MKFYKHHKINESDDVIAIAIGPSPLLEKDAITIVKIIKPDRVFRWKPGTKHIVRFLDEWSELSNIEKVKYL